MWFKEIGNSIDISGGNGEVYLLQDSCKNAHRQSIELSRRQRTLQSCSRRVYQEERQEEK